MNNWDLGRVENMERTGESEGNNQPRVNTGQRRKDIGQAVVKGVCLMANNGERMGQAQRERRQTESKEAADGNLAQPFCPC